MSRNDIAVKGARVHNLKNVDVSIPRNKLVVFTGVSGSGKSSLAFDTIYAEGNRRFMESLSSYVRQFVGGIDKPDVDSIEGLSPSISIDQKTTSKNPRSTVGTVTEIYDYLRLLFARVGVPHCPICHKEIRQQTIDQIVDKIMEYPEGTKFMIMSPVVVAKKGMHERVFEKARKEGFVRLRVDGRMRTTDEEISLEKNLRHDIDIVVDRLVMKEDIRSRVADSVETASSMSGGVAIVSVIDGEEQTFSQNYACIEHGISLGELTPKMFSFNSPLGACPKCDGLGVLQIASAAKIVPDETLSLRMGAVKCLGFYSLGDDSYSDAIVIEVGKAYGFDLDTPICDMSPEAKNALYYGCGDRVFEVERKGKGKYSKSYETFDGIVNIIQKRYNSASNEFIKGEYARLIEEEDCPLCHGKRVNKEALAVTVAGKNIAEICEMSIGNALRFFEQMKLSERDAEISREIVKELVARLNFLLSVGLDYLTLARSSGSLSGGESQRIRLATQIGSSLMGVLYILDEPSIGLHQRDNVKLLRTLERLRDTGNTVIVVEHDEETMRAADYIVDVGPRAGVHGGKIVAVGTPAEVAKNKNSLTGDYLSGRRKIEIPLTRRKGNGNTLTVSGAREHNLKNLTVTFPLGTFCCVTGVSGSGKSSLVNEILYKALARKLNGAYTTPGLYSKISGVNALDKVINIDQSPIGRTPRSNPATYTGVFTDIRELFASTKDAKARGYDASRFSFNVKGGRCEACRGDGTTLIEMNFLPDVYIKCDVCKGARYNRETLEVKYKDKSISDVLEMTVDEALVFFDSIPKIKRKIQTLADVGLGYIQLGQSSTTLSGGEAQRVKLATELSKKSTGKTVYILDEPTTGLHSYDVNNLITILQRLVDSGNSVIVIEHNLDVIKCADYIVDLGPEGGDRGGTLVCAGTPEEVARCEDSYTGYFLKDILKERS